MIFHPDQIRSLTPLITGLIGAVAGSLSLGRLIYLDLQGKRARLGAATVRGVDDMLKVRISYRPEFAHIGLSARVSVLAGSEVAALPGVRPVQQTALGVMNSTFERTHVSEDIGEIALDGDPKVATVRLLHLPPDGEGVYAGLVWLQRDDDEPVGVAKIKIEVHSDDGRRLVARILRVSAVD